MKLNIGDPAPDFSVPNQEGKMVKLSDYKGKKIILYFYPRDNTPTCTKEACNLRDNYHSLLDKGFEVIGVSTDAAKSHQKFISKHQLPFDLLADTEKEIHQKYGSWVEKSMYGRTYMGTARVTFVIDEKGKIIDIIEKVKAKEHAAQIIG